MTAPLAVPAILLALVLTFSAAAKLASSKHTDAAFISLRLPAWLRTLRAPVLLPWGELALAVLLLVTSGPLAVLTAVAALVLFVLYLVVIVRALTFEEKVTCSCFGELGLGEVTVLTAVRNLLLVALSALVLYDATRGTSVLGRVIDYSAASWLWLALIGVAIALTWLITGAHGSARTSTHQAASTPMLFERVTGTVYDVEDRPVAVESLTRPDQHTLLLFASPTCGSCHTTLEQVRTWQAQTMKVRVVVVLTMRVDDTYGGLANPSDFEIYFDPDMSLLTHYSGVTPSALLFDSDGHLLSALAVGSERVEHLMRTVDTDVWVPAATEVETTSAPQPAPAARTPAAPSENPDEAYLRAPNPYVLFTDIVDQPCALNSLANPAVGPAILLQVSPGCSPCEYVLEQVDEWVRQVAPIPLYLVVASTEHREVLRSRGFDAGHILLDEHTSLAHMMQLANPGLFAAGGDGYLLAGPVNGGEAVAAVMDDIIAEIRGLYPDEAATTNAPSPER